MAGDAEMWSPCVLELAMALVPAALCCESNRSPPNLITKHCNTPFLLLPPHLTPQTIFAIFQSGDFDLISPSGHVLCV